MVLPKSSDDGYTGGSPKDVSGDGRYQTGKRTTTQCSRNPLALPERGIDKCAIDHADYLFMHGENIKSGTTLKMETTRSSIVRTWKSVMRHQLERRFLEYGECYRIRFRD